MKRIIFMLLTLGFFLFVQSAQADWLAAKMLTWNTGNSSCPAVAVDSNGVHVAYHDRTPGNIEVNYKKYAR